MTYDPTAIPVCSECLEAEQKLCKKCGIAYCTHFASPTDVRYCHNCMLDFDVITQTEIRTTEHTNSAGVITYTKRDYAKSLKLTGTDWLFTARAINTLSDDELDATIEYHSAIKGLMLREREDRRIEKYQKLSKMVVPFKPRTDVNSDGSLKGSEKTPKQKAASTTIKKSKSSSNQLADAMALLLKSGMTLEQIAAKMGAKK